MGMGGNGVRFLLLPLLIAASADDVTHHRTKMVLKVPVISTIKVIHRYVTNIIYGRARERVS
jgi:hypothetical protein